MKNALSKFVGNGFLGQAKRFSLEVAVKTAKKEIGRFRKALNERFNLTELMQDYYKGVQPAKPGCGG